MIFPVPMDKYLYRYGNISPRINAKYLIFHQFVTEVWRFTQANAIETRRLHPKFFNCLLGVITSTQNDFVYGELGGKSLTYNIQILKHIERLD